jgi:hypothetical protein
MSAAATILTTFGLNEQELARALHVSNAVIFGGAALTWYLGEESPRYQDLDIACRPASEAMHKLIHALFDTLLRHAGYGHSRANAPSNAYTVNPSTQIETVYTWFNYALYRHVQLVIRKPDAPSIAPTDASDLDVARVTVVPRGTSLVPQLPPELSPSQVATRRMHFHSLAGQNYQNLRRRLVKYYGRGFTMEETATGRALTLEQALEAAAPAWAAANPLPDTDMRRADVLRTHLNHFFEGVTDPLTKQARTIDALILLCRTAILSDLNNILYDEALCEVRHTYKLLVGIGIAHRILAATTQEDLRNDEVFEDFYMNLAVNTRFPEVAIRVRMAEASLFQESPV